MQALITAHFRAALGVSAVLVFVSPRQSSAQEQHIYRLRITQCRSGGAPRIQSAFKLAGESVLVTALHGIADCDEIHATDFRGQPAFGYRNLVPVRFDLRHDVAELELPSTVGTSGLVPVRTLPAALDRLEVFGFQLGRTVNRGTPVRLAYRVYSTIRSWGFPTRVQQQLDDRGSPDPDEQLLDVADPIRPGHSGGPIVDLRTSMVIGVAEGGLNAGGTAENFAIPWPVIRWVQFDKRAAQRLGPPLKFLFDVLNDSPVLPQIATQRVPEGQTGTVVFPNGVGYIPGLQGRLNPILDSENRTYIYAENTALNGGRSQPLAFIVNQPFVAEDAHGNRFRLTVTAINGLESRLTYEKLPSNDVDTVGAFSVNVSSGSGPVGGADVSIDFPDHTSISGTTDRNGVVEFAHLKRSKVSVVIVANGFEPYILAECDAHVPLSADLRARTDPNSGSISFHGTTGYIPGLQGRLNPILDDLGRTYIYADSISIDGGKPQPYHFAIGQPFVVEDTHGNRYELTVLTISSHSSTIQYRKLQ